AKGIMNSRTAFENCVTVSLDMEQNFRQLTVDFAEGGCIIRGHLFEGQIVITYERDPQAQNIFLGYVLNDFYFDNKHVMGYNSILKDLSKIHVNLKFTLIVDLLVFWHIGMKVSMKE